MKPQINHDHSASPSLQSLHTPKVPAYPQKEVAAFFRTCLTAGLTLSWVGESEKCLVHLTENEKILLRTQTMDEATCKFAWEVWRALASDSSIHTSAEELLSQLIENVSFMNSISPQMRADLVTAGDPPRGDCPALAILMLSPHLITLDTVDRIINMAIQYPSAAFAVRLPDNPFFRGVDGKEHWERLVKEVSLLSENSRTISASIRRRIRNEEALFKELGELSKTLSDDAASTAAVAHSKRKNGKSSAKAQAKKQASTQEAALLPKMRHEDPIVNAIINDTEISSQELAAWQEKRIDFYFPDHQRHATQVIQALTAPKWRSVDWVGRLGRDTACRLVNTGTVADLVALGLTARGDSSLLVGVAENSMLFSELLEVDPGYVVELRRRVLGDEQPNRFMSIVRGRMLHPTFDARYGAQTDGVPPKEFKLGIAVKREQVVDQSESHDDRLRDGRLMKTALSMMALFDTASPEYLATVPLPDAISLGYFVRKLTSLVDLGAESCVSEELARRRFFAATNPNVVPTRKAATYLARYGIANPIAPETIGLVNNVAFKAKLVEGLRYLSVPELIRSAGRSQIELEELAALVPEPSYAKLGVNQNFLSFLATVKGRKRL
jgi:hypothetical protein